MRNEPVARYRYTLVVTGNTIDEIRHELTVQANGEFDLDGALAHRDSWRVTGPRTEATMSIINPEMTPERYQAELGAWRDEVKARREADR